MLNPTLTVNEAAMYLKMRPRTVREWIASGKIRARKMGRAYVILEDELRRVLTPVAPADEVKEYDPERAGRIAALREMLVASGVTSEALLAQRERDRELEEEREKRAMSE
jgi:excisionase family DNA binding protein